MRLQCLLVTQQHELLELMRPALARFAIEVEVRTDAASSLEVCRRRHLDGFFIDCDDVAGGQELVLQVRASGSNRLSSIFAIVNGATSVNEALGKGANFVLGKPISEDRLLAYLKIARVFMEREHRRYFRYTADVPIHLHTEDQTIEGRLVNISEGGMAVRLPGAASVEGAVRLSFDIPSLEPHTAEAKGDVVWRDAGGLIGIRFLYMTEEARRELQKWLAQLHSQLELRDPQTGDDQDPMGVPTTQI